MKKCVIALISVLLCGVLAGCGGGEKAPFDPEKTPRALMDAGAFSEELQELDRAILDQFYGLEGSGVTKGACFYSPGATAEEVTVLCFGSAGEAEAFMDRAREHIDDQLEANEFYRPAEAPKLKDAVIERRGESLLVLVADDYAAARAVLD